jgi:hypothetical protein
MSLLCKLECSRELHMQLYSPLLHHTAPEAYDTLTPSTSEINCRQSQQTTKTCEEVLPTTTLNNTLAANKSTRHAGNHSPKSPCRTFLSFFNHQLPPFTPLPQGV